jgi:hypothetical protein
MGQTVSFIKAASVLYLSLFLCGCVSAQEKASVSLFRDSAANDDSVYYVQAPAGLSERTELTECLFRAVRQIAIRTEVRVVFSVTPVRAADGTSLTRETVSLDFNQDNGVALSDRLDVIKSARSGSGIEALVKLRGKTGFRKASVTIKSKIGADGNPSWVSRPPKGTGFHAAVRSVAQHTNTGDAFQNADSQAIGALSQAVSNPTVSGTTQTYTAVLHGAYIARRWYNAREKRWYSLAILPQ